MEKKKTEIIEFSKTLYSQEALESAIKTFEDVCNIEEVQTEKSHILHISAPSDKIREIKGEFSNYALGCMKENHSQ